MIRSPVRPVFLEHAVVPMLSIPLVLGELHIAQAKFPQVEDREIAQDVPRELGMKTYEWLDKALVYADQKILKALEWRFLALLLPRQLDRCSNLYQVILFVSF